MKKFFTATKYLWIGGLVGIIQQLFGELDSTLQHSRLSLFSFTGILGTFTIYAGIILLIIKRDAPPKHQFRDVLLFFVGLDVFYYLYEFGGLFVSSVLLNPNSMSNEELMFSIDGILGAFAKNFAYWTAIGLAAAVWSFFATKFRNSEKKKLYVLMLVPLFAVIIIELLVFSYGAIMFGIQQYNIAHNIASPDGSYYVSGFSNILTSLVMLVLCLYIYLKKPTEKKNITQEA